MAASTKISAYDHLLQVVCKADESLLLAFQHAGIDSLPKLSSGQIGDSIINNLTNINTISSSTIIINYTELDLAAARSRKTH